MKQEQRNIVATSLAVVLLAGCSLLSGLSNPFVGKWQGTAKYIEAYDFELDNHYTSSFKDAATGKIVRSDAGKYSYTSTTLSLVSSTSSATDFVYDFSGTKLTLTPSNGSGSITLTKQ